ncbi:hypothetical protein D3C78_860740 [compost metagenome]
MSTGQLDLAVLALTEQGNFTGLLLVGNHGQLVTGFRGTVQAEDFDRDRRAGFLHRLAVLVEHGAHAAIVGTAQDHVALTQGTVLNQDGRHRATALVQARFDNHATTWSGRGSGQLEDLGLQQDSFEQLVDAGTHLRRNLDERSITTPVLGGHAFDGQFVADAIDIGTRLVDLVHRNHQRNASCLGMLNGFAGLRHHAVVRRHHQDDDVGSLGTTGTHCGERSVAWGIEEGDHAAVGFHVVGTDVLGNTTGFASGNLGTTDVVEQRGLTMVNVTHDGNDRRTRFDFTFELQRFGQGVFQGGIADQGHFVAQFFGDQLSGFLVEHLVDGDRGTQLEHELDHFSGLDRHLLGQFRDGDGLADGHVTDDWTGRVLEAVLVALLQLALATAATAYAIALFIGGARCGTRSRSLFLLLDLDLDRHARGLATTLATTTVFVTGAAFVATGFVLLALGSTGCGVFGRRSIGNYRGRGSGRRRLWLGGRRRGCSSGIGGLTASLLFVALANFGLDLFASGIFSRAALFQFTLLLSLDFFRAALHEYFLLAYFYADALATGDTQGAGGFALQGDLARLFHFCLVAALQMSQQCLLLIVGHYLTGVGVRQTCLTHLLQQALYRCLDLLGQFFHRDLRHALLSSGRA